MALAPGTRLGVFEVTAQMGVGGMGEVYRARDTRLGREVAIKVLPPGFAEDAERLARFEREARVLASLNHPHIAAIYGVEEGDSVLALVLELVEGETLADRLAHDAGRTPRGLPVADALALARQVADALDAAHEKGIVHRDLKPGNIMVTPAGVVKVLDFGLAKGGGDVGTGADLTHSPTMIVHATGTGVLLGTAAYMSPEQARGLAVDKRTDIWAFGCVLYELLTGKKAFPGATLSDTLAAILEREPDWSALPAATPARVRLLLRRCLAKQPSRRIRDIGDASLDLDVPADDAESLTATQAAGTRHRGSLRRVGAAAVLIALIAAGVAALMWRGAPAERAAQLTVGPMTRLTSDPGLTTEPSLSADGRLVAYASNRSGEGNLDVYVQQTTGGTAIRLTEDPADDHQPDVSPDGSLVAFRSERSPRGVYVASALGGGSRLIAPDGMAPRFSPDGRSMAFWAGPWLAPRSDNVVRQTFVMPVTGGAPTRVATNIASAGDPIWAPDGRSLLVFGRQATSGANTDPDWWWVPVEGGEAVRTGAYERFKLQRIRLNNTDSYPYPQAWTADGVLFAAESGTGDARNLWVIALDPRSGRPMGDPTRLTNGTTFDEVATMARDGQIVFSAQTVVRATFSLPLDANVGRAAGVLGRVREDTVATGRTSVSEDGRLLALSKYELDAGGLWVRDLRTGNERQLAATPRTPLNPVMSVDGRWAAYTVTKVETGGNSGPGDGYVVATDRGAPRKVCESCQIDLWSRDNGQVVISDPERAALVRIDVATGTRIPLVAGTAGALDRPMFGPNGRWFTFNSPRGVYVAPVHADRASSESEWTKVIDTSGGAERTAGMSPDGSLLYVLLERDGFRCLYAMRLDPGTGQPGGEPFLVAHFHDATRRWGSTGMGSAVASGVFLADLFETTGNIWMTTLERLR